MKLILLQPGQPGEGMDYNVHKPLPRPYYVNVNTWQLHHRHYKLGDPLWTLIGFVSNSDVFDIEVERDELLFDIQSAVGKVPVFSEKGRFFNLTVPITNVQLFDFETVYNLNDGSP